MNKLHGCVNNIVLYIYKYLKIGLREYCTVTCTQRGPGACVHAPTPNTLNTQWHVNGTRTGDKSIINIWWIYNKMTLVLSLLSFFCLSQTGINRKNFSTNNSRKNLVTSIFSSLWKFSRKCPGLLKYERFGSLMLSV